MSSTVSSTYARTGNTLTVVIGEDEAVLEAELDGDRIMERYMLIALLHLEALMMGEIFV